MVREIEHLFKSHVNCWPSQILPLRSSIVDVDSMGRRRLNAAAGGFQATEEHRVDFHRQRSGAPWPPGERRRTPREEQIKNDNHGMCVVPLRRKCRCLCWNTLTLQKVLIICSYFVSCWRNAAPLLGSSSAHRILLAPSARFVGLERKKKKEKTIRMHRVSLQNVSIFHTPTPMVFHSCYCIFNLEMGGTLGCNFMLVLMHRWTGRHKNSDAWVHHAIY